PPVAASGVRAVAFRAARLGDPTAARPLFERALAIRERVLGPDHPDTAATRRALEELAGGRGTGGRGRLIGSVDDREGVNLDQQLGVSKGLHAEHDVRGLVVAEYRDCAC